MRFLRSVKISPLYLKKSGPRYCFQLVAIGQMLAVAIQNDVKRIFFITPVRPNIVQQRSIQWINDHTDIKVIVLIPSQKITN